MDLRMDRPMLDYADARNMMVDGQVRPNKVYDPRLLKAMRTLPRERFLPSAMAALAYTDDDVPLPRGRVLLQPMVIGRLLQTAAVRSGETALVIGSGSGYGAALLAACGAKVTALEDDPELLELARKAADLAPGVTRVEGPLAAGWAAGAPYGLVLIEGAVSEIPAGIVSQVKLGGRVLAIRAGSGRLGHAVIGEPAVAGKPLSLQPIFDCPARVIPAFKAAPGFVF